MGSIYFFGLLMNRIKIKRKYDPNLVKPNMSRTTALGLLPSFLWYSSGPWGELINPHLFAYTQFEAGNKPRLVVPNTKKNYLEHLRTGSDTRGYHLPKLTGKLYAEMNGPHPEFSATTVRSQAYAKSGCGKNALTALDIDNKENRYSQAQMDEIASYVATELLGDAYYEPSTCEAGRTIYFVFNRQRYNKTCVDTFFKMFTDSIKQKIDSRGWDSDYLIDGWFGHTPEKLFRLPRFTNTCGDFHQFFSKPLTIKKLCDAGLGNYNSLRYATSAPRFKVQFNWNARDYWLNNGRDTSPVIRFSDNPFVVDAQPISNNKNTYYNRISGLTEISDVFQRTQQLWLQVFFKHGKRLNGSELCELYEGLELHTGDETTDKKERLSRCNRVVNFFLQEYGVEDSETTKSSEFMQFLRDRYPNVTLTKEEVNGYKDQKLSAFKGQVQVEDMLVFLWMVESAKATDLSNRFTVGLRQMADYGSRLYRSGVLKTTMTTDKASFVRKIAQVRGWVELVEGEVDGRCRRYVPSEGSPVRSDFIRECGDDLKQVQSRIEVKPFVIEYWASVQRYVEVWREGKLIQYRPAVRPPKSTAIWFSNLVYSDGRTVCRTPRWITESKIPRKTVA